jgi:hypothetical protein
MSESKILMSMRRMAWQRAKGELNSYLETYWPEYKTNGEKIDHGFEDASRRIEAFIREFEDNQQ